MLKGESVEVNHTNVMELIMIEYFFLFYNLFLFFFVNLSNTSIVPFSRSVLKFQSLRYFFKLCLIFAISNYSNASSIA